jgi:hypothetical protein
MYTLRSVRRLGFVALLATTLLPFATARTAARALHDASAPYDASAYAAQATVPTNMTGVYAFPAPPAGFDPLKASPRQLVQYGLPQPPDPKAMPEQYEFWLQVMRTPLVHVTPSFTPHPEVRFDTDSNWSGTALTGPANSLGMVQGEWVVPSVSGARVGSKSATWVGIDGYGNSQVEQEGTAQEASATGTHYYAWFELCPQPSNTTNLHVKAGQTIYSYVKTNASTTYFYMLNLTTRNYLSFSVAGGCLCQSAEWIAERPADANGTDYLLARFGKDVITGEIAGTSSTGVGWWAHRSPFAEHTIDLIAGRTTLAHTTNLGARTDMITWQGYS